MTGFTIFGVFIVLLIIVTAFVLIIGALNANDPMFGFEGGCIAGMIVVIILLLAYLSVLSVTSATFKRNPEMYGYVKIEEEE